MMNRRFIKEVINNVKYSGIEENGFYWDALTKQRMYNKKGLEAYGYKVYSQNDEDGIIHEIFRRIGTTNKTFVEFGVQDGLESNSHLLLFYDWNGLWIVGSLDYYKKIKTKFRPVIEAGQLKVTNAFIDKDNINELIMDAGIQGEIDLLSVDIDGNDYYIWDTIDCINPRVVICEYNGKFPPDLNWVQAYDKNHIWDESDWQGASLKAFELLGRKKGYTLVGTNIRGCNAFFVRNDLIKRKFIKVGTAEYHYNPLRFRLEYRAYHIARYCLKGQKENYGILNYYDYRLKEGFYEIETVGDVHHAWTNAVDSSFDILVKGNVSKIIVPVKTLSNVEYTKTVKFYGDGIKDIAVNFNENDLSVELDVDINEITNSNRMIRVCIHNENKLQSPCDYMIGSADNRKLGININFSSIRYE